MSEAGSLALAQVKRWLQDSLVRPADLPVKELPVSSVLARDLSRSYEVQRLDDGAIMAESVTAKILDAIADRAAEDAYAGFVARDDHAGAGQLIDVLRAERADELADRLASRQPDDRAVSRERLRELLARTERELAQALYTALLSESESADLRGEWKSSATSTWPTSPPPGDGSTTLSSTSPKPAAGPSRWRASSSPA